jgi:hypothetical protein
VVALGKYYARHPPRQYAPPVVAYQDAIDTGAYDDRKPTKYVGRYARKTDEEREAMIEAALNV